MDKAVANGNVMLTKDHSRAVGCIFELIDKFVSTGNYRFLLLKTRSCSALKHNVKSTIEPCWITIGCRGRRVNAADEPKRWAVS
jgi:hypothetical protein